MVEFSFLEALGYIGVVLFVMSYILLSYGKLTAGHPTYHLMNIFGALFLIANALSVRDMPSLLVNVIWFFIGLSVLIRLFKKSKSKVK